MGRPQTTARHETSISQLSCSCSAGRREAAALGDFVQLALYGCRVLCGEKLPAASTTERSFFAAPPPPPDCCAAAAAAAGTIQGRAADRAKAGGRCHRQATPAARPDTAAKHQTPIPTSNNPGTLGIANRRRLLGKEGCIGVEHVGAAKMVGGLDTWSVLLLPCGSHARLVARLPVRARGVRGLCKVCCVRGVAGLRLASWPCHGFLNRADPSLCAHESGARGLIERNLTLIRIGGIAAASCVQKSNRNRKPTILDVGMLVCSDI